MSWKHLFEIYFRLLRRNNKLKINNFLMNIWRNNWRFNIWRRKRTPLLKLLCKTWKRKHRKYLRKSFSPSTNLYKCSWFDDWILWYRKLWTSSRKKSGLGDLNPWPLLLYVHCKNTVLSDTSSLRTLAPSEKKKFLNKMVNTKNENVLDVWRKRK